jgi:cell division protein FtsW
VSGGLLLIIVPALVLGASFVSYIRERLSIFLGDSTNEQVSSAFDAIASGGWLGAGFTQGTFRTAGLQYQQSDYVFSLVGEEFGLLGMLIVVGLFAALLVYTLRLVGSLSDRFSSLVVFGLLITVVFQAMLHMQVVTGLAPPKGMILPFLSEGGTALVSSCLAVGLALGAAREEQGGVAS